MVAKFNCTMNDRPKASCSIATFLKLQNDLSVSISANMVDISLQQEPDAHHWMEYSLIKYIAHTAVPNQFIPCTSSGDHRSALFLLLGWPRFFDYLGCCPTSCFLKFRTKLRAFPSAPRGTNIGSQSTY